MDKYKIITLGNTAIVYIRDCLVNGLTLSKYMLEKLDLNSGQVITVLPKDANFDTIGKFDLGGKLRPPPKSEWREMKGTDGKKFLMVPRYSFTYYVASSIRSFLESGARRLCIFEDAISRPSDLALQHRKSHFVTFQDEVYYLLIGRAYADKDIEQTVKEAGHDYPPLICAMTSLPSEEHTLFNKQTITSGILGIMAERTEKVVVGAYDGEGYLIWHKR